MNTDRTGISKQSRVWRPNAIAGWSVLLTPIFGAWLTYLNWQDLGETGRAATSRYWLACSILWIAASGAMVIIAVEPEYLIGAAIAYVLFLMAWYLAENRIQHSYIRMKSRSHNGYAGRRWLMPLAIALGVFVVFQFAFWETYAGRVFSSPQCTHEHAVGNAADYRSEIWSYCW